jgi:hypothetical protein
MQISKFLTAICAIAVCAGNVSVRAQDNPAQAAARAALMEKMNGLDAPAAMPTNAMPPVAVAPAPATPEPAVTNTDTAPTMPPAETAPAAEPAQPVTTPAPVMDNPPAVSVDAQAAPKVVAPVEMAPGTVQSQMAPTVPAAADSGADTAAQAAARAALLEKMATLDSQSPTPPTPTTPAAMPAVAPVVAQPVKPADVDNSAKEVDFRPIEAPSLPISMSKEAQLQALLAQYKADQITPEQYFKQRAAILAQP